MSADDLDKMTREMLAGIVLDETLKSLVKRIRAGEATAAELNVALNAARYLNIGMVPTDTNSAGALRNAVTKDLPFPTDGMSH